MNLLVFNLKMDADDSVLGFTTEWVNSLARQCERVVVITNEAGALRVDANVTVFSLGRELGRGRARKTLAFYAILWRVLRTRRIDVCFAHMNFLFALIGSPLLRLFGVPTVLWYAHGATPLLLRPAVWTVARVVTSSERGFRLASRKVRIVGQGIDTERFHPAPVSLEPAGAIRLLSLGRMSPVKRNDMLIEAMARLRSTAPHLDLRCDFVGDPPTDDGRACLVELKARSHALGLDDVIRFLPGVPFHRVPEVLRQADLLVNCADTGSVDKAVLEALSCGVPVVTSNEALAAILPASLRLGVIPRNDVDALADAIRRFAEMPAAERAQVAAGGRQFVSEQHSLAALTSRLMAEFRAVSGKAGAGAVAPDLAHT